MGFAITPAGYVEYLKEAARVIEEQGEYITGLDAATGDGDHWVNLNMGFQKLVESAGELAELPLGGCLQKIGMLMMSTIGGSSGILYGGAYLAAAKAVEDREALDARGLCLVLRAMVDAIMARGKAQPGQKTMIDALHPAVLAYEEGLAAGIPEEELLANVKEAAEKGAESTRAMEAMRGRACYQQDKGRGHLDPGAVTMALQISSLVDFVGSAL